MAVDDSYSKSLLHMDGANGSTTFTDESGKIWTPVSDAKISTAESVFGGASGLFDGAADCITTPNVSDFDLTGVDFTIDFRFRTSSTTQYACFVSSEGSTGYTILINHDSASDGKIAFYCTGLGAANGLRTTTTGYNDGQWHHLALVRYGINFTIYIDGVSRAAAADAAPSNTPNGALFSVGKNLAFPGRDYAGYIDEYRFSKGIARWTAPFIPPTDPYGPAAPTDDSRITGATLLSELSPASAGKASGALLLSEIQPASRGKISGAMLLVEMTASPNPFGIIPTTLAARSTAATLRTKRKTYATLNERETTLTLEERP